MITVTTGVLVNEKKIAGAGHNGESIGNWSRAAQKHHCANGYGILGEASGGNSAVECQLPKLDVAGSIPVSRSNFFNNLSKSIYADFFLTKQANGLDLIFELNAVSKGNCFLTAFLSLVPRNPKSAIQP